MPSARTKCLASTFLNCGGVSLATAILLDTNRQAKAPNMTSVLLVSLIFIKLLDFLDWREIKMAFRSWGTPLAMALLAAPGGQPTPLSHPPTFSLPPRLAAR